MFTLITCCDVKCIVTNLAYKQALVLKAIARYWYIMYIFFFENIGQFLLLWSFLVIWIFFLIIRLSSFMESFFMKCITYLRSFYISLSYKICQKKFYRSRLSNLFPPYWANNYFFKGEKSVFYRNGIYSIYVWYMLSCVLLSVCYSKLHN